MNIYNRTDLQDIIPHKLPEDLDSLLALYEQAHQDVLRWLGLLEDTSDESRKYVNFTWMYAYYRNFEYIVKELTNELSDEQWDEVEKLREMCEKYRQMYGPNLIPVDLEP